MSQPAPAPDEPTTPVPSGAAGTARPVAVALAANLAAAAAKLVGFAVSGSSGLLAEALHSFADCGNQILLLLGRRHAARPPTARHPFGYGRLRFFWAFVAAELLFGGGAVFAIADGIHRLGRHEHPDHLTFAVVALAVAGVIELGSLVEALGEARRQRGGRSLRSFVRETTDPDLAILLTEDASDIVGIVFALVGIGLADATGNAAWDAAAGIAIGAVLAGNALLLAWEMGSLLIGEAPPAESAERIRAAILGSPGVLELRELRTMQLGPHEVLVVARAVLDAGSGAPPGEGSELVAREVRRALPDAVHVFVHPVSPSR